MYTYPWPRFDSPPLRPASCRRHCWAKTPDTYALQWDPRTSTPCGWWLKLGSWKWVFQGGPSKQANKSQTCWTFGAESSRKCACDTSSDDWFLGGESIGLGSLSQGSQLELTTLKYRNQVTRVEITSCLYYVIFPFALIIPNLLVCGISHLPSCQLTYIT